MNLNRLNNRIKNLERKKPQTCESCKERNQWERDLDLLDTDEQAEYESIMSRVTRTERSCQECGEPIHPRRDFGQLSRAEKLRLRALEEKLLVRKDAQ